MSLSTLFLVFLNLLYSADLGLHKPYSKERRRAAGNDGQRLQNRGGARQCRGPAQAGDGEEAGLCVPTFLLWFHYYVPQGSTV